MPQGKHQCSANAVPMHHNGVAAQASRQVTKHTSHNDTMTSSYHCLNFDPSITGIVFPKACLHVFFALACFSYVPGREAAKSIACEGQAGNGHGVETFRCEGIVLNIFKALVCQKGTIGITGVRKTPLEAILLCQKMSNSLPANQSGMRSIQYPVQAI